MIDISIGTIWGNVWPYLIAVALFLILIVIHEFGHFIAAKSVGVKVNEFAVGFGPKLFAKKLGDTIYKINLIPLGGYCAMEGEDESSVDSRAFCNKSAVKRLTVVVMGALFNLLLGLILISVTLVPEESFTTTTVDCFKENSSSQESGLMENDKIVAVDGRKIYSTYDLSYAFTNIDDGKIDITVIRNGEKKKIKNVEFETEEYDGIKYLTVDFWVKANKKTFVSFISQTVKLSASYCAVVYRSLFDILAGKYGISAVSGPVGTTVVIGNIAKQNLSMLLPIMALITINLGLFNLLPIPALDGGRILFIIIEIITRRKVPQKYESIVHTVGFIILLAFMFLITAKDIWGLIK